MAKRVGRNIAKCRRDKNLTQEKSSEKTHGISLRYWQYMERGERNFTLKTLNKISKVLKVKIEDLFKK